MISAQEPTRSAVLPELCGTKVICRDVLGSEISERTLRKLISSGRFPRPDVRLSAKLRFWKRETILEWIEHQDGRLR